MFLISFTEQRFDFSISQPQILNLLNQPELILIIEKINHKNKRNNFICYLTNSIDRYYIWCDLNAFSSFLFTFFVVDYWSSKISYLWTGDLFIISLGDHSRERIRCLVIMLGSLWCDWLIVLHSWRSKKWLVFLRILRRCCCSSCCCGGLLVLCKSPIFNWEFS